MGKDSSLGKQVKTFRLAKLWTQTRMAEETGVSIATVNRVERGREISPLTRARIEKYLDAQKIVLT